MKLEDDLRDTLGMNANGPNSVDSVQQESTYINNSEAEFLTDNENIDEKVLLILLLFNLVFSHFVLCASKCSMFCQKSFCNFKIFFISLTWANWQSNNVYTQ